MAAFSKGIKNIFTDLDGSATSQWIGGFASSENQAKMKEVKGSERKHYTMLHRFVFNLKRILQKVGLGSRLGSFAVAAALLFKENKEAKKHQLVIEAAVVTYLKQTDQYDSMLSENINIPDIQETPIMNCFGVDVFEQNGELISEYDYDKTL